MVRRRSKDQEGRECSVGSNNCGYQTGASYGRLSPAAPKYSLALVYGDTVYAS